MWLNPKYRNQPPPGPPPDPGRVLATLPRGFGEQLRVTLAEYEGHPYVSLRVWAPGPDGKLWPVKGEGCSIRISELGEVAEAPAEALEIAGG